VYALESDDDFQALLNAKDHAGIHPESFTVWREQRAQLQQLVHGLSAYRFGFTPREHTPLTVVTHMFMHGSLGHLIGNMLVLLIIGPLVELAFGGWRYLAGYLFCGLTAVGLFWASQLGSATPLVGASGAIAGVMGMYAWFYGARRIKVFYSVLFYFDYVAARAYWLFPVWIGNEIFQWITEFGSHVAYLAHVGGLLGGALVGLLFRAPVRATLDKVFEKRDQQDTLHILRERIERELRAMRIDRARPLLAELVRQVPEDAEAIRRWLRLEKLAPANPAFRAAVQASLALKSSTSAITELQREAFEHYLPHATPNDGISMQAWAALGRRLWLAGYAQQANQLVNLLLPRADARGVLPDLLLQGIQCWKKLTRLEDVARYRALLTERFPDSEAAKIAGLTAG